MAREDGIWLQDWTTGDNLQINADGSIKARLLDSSGTSVTVGQKVMANSIPVVSASDQLYASGNGTISSYPQGITISTLGRGDVKIHVTGSFSGTIVPYMTVNGSQLGIIPILNLSTGAYVSSITSTGMFIIPASNAYNIQLWSSSWASGTATIYWVAGPGVSEIDIRTWLGSQAPTVGQKTMAASLPVTIASDQPILAAAAIQVNGKFVDENGNTVLFKSKQITYNPPTVGDQATAVIAAVSGKKLRVFSVFVALGIASSNVYLRNGAGGTQLSPLYLRTTGGSVPSSYWESAYTGSFLFETTANTALVCNSSTNTGPVSIKLVYAEV